MTPSNKNRRFRILIAAIVLAAVAAFIGSRSLRSNPLEQAREEAANGATNSAIQQYLAYLDASPQNHDARLELAELLKPLDSKSALQQLQMIPPTVSAYPQAIWHIAHIAMVGKQDALAEDALKKLDAVRPNDSGVALTLAELYYRTDRYTQALTWVRQAARLKPERALTWLLMAEILDHLRRPGEMLQPLKTAIELDPELYSAHANLAYALQFSGQPEEAEAQARWCLARQPDDMRVRRWLAMILRDLGEYDAAMKQVRLALEDSPANVDCRIVEADLLLFARDAEGAYNVLIPLYRAHSNRRDYLSSLARAAAMSGRREESRRYQLELLNLIAAESDHEDPAPPVSQDTAH